MTRVNAMLWKFVVLLIILTQFSACSGGGTTDVPTVVAPGVFSVVPASNATGIALNSGVSVAFSELMDPATITTSTFTLRSSTGAVAGTVTASGAAALFRPASPLQAGTIYTATVTGGARNLAGTPMAGSFSWSFTTGTSTDTVPPAVSLTTPANGATNAFPGAVAAVFSEAMDPTSLTAATFTLSTGGTNVPGKVSYSGITAIFSANGGLHSNTPYSATITGARDLAGNPVPDYSWDFSTGSVIFGTQPRVTSTTPASNATGIAVTTTLTAKFNVVMDPATITTTTFQLLQGTTAVPGTVALDTMGTLATFTPSAQLAPNTTYTAKVTADAKSATGTLLATTATWIFTTGTTGDTVRPTVVSTVPTANGTGISRNAVITATFSEGLDAATVTTSTMTVTSTAGAVTGTVTLDTTGLTATFTPSAALAPNTAYTVTLSGVKDVAGNALSGAYTWNFTTGAS